MHKARLYTLTLPTVKDIDTFEVIMRSNLTTNDYDRTAYPRLFALARKGLALELREKEQADASKVSSAQLDMFDTRGGRPCT
jgi:hypothetical protein